MEAAISLGEDFDAGGLRRLARQGVSDGLGFV